MGPVILPPYQNMKKKIASLENLNKEDLEEKELFELKELYEDVKDFKRIQIDILESKIDNAGKTFRYNLLISAALITAFSFLFQSNIVSIKSLNDPMLLFSISLITCSSVSSILAFRPVKWENKDLIPLKDSDGSSDKSQLIRKITEESRSIEERNKEIGIRNHLIEVSIWLMLIAITFLGMNPLSRAVSLSSSFLLMLIFTPITLYLISVWVYGRFGLDLLGLIVNWLPIDAEYREKTSED